MRRAVAAEAADCQGALSDSSKNKWNTKSPTTTTKNANENFRFANITCAEAISESHLPYAVHYDRAASISVYTVGAHAQKHTCWCRRLHIQTTGTVSKTRKRMRVEKSARQKDKKSNKNVLSIFGFLRHIIRMPHIDRQVNINTYSYRRCLAYRNMWWASTVICMHSRRACTCPISLFQILDEHLLPLRAGALNT